MSEDTQNVPLSTARVIEEVHAVNELGITIAHLHARDEALQPSHKLEHFAEIFEGVRRHCPDLIISASLSGRYVSDWSLRSEVLALKPDMGSLTLSSLNFARNASVNAPDTIVKLVAEMDRFGVNPELECFDLGMIQYGKYLQQKGIIPRRAYWNLLFGNLAGAQADLCSMAAMVQSLPEHSHVAFAGLGRAQLKATSIAIALGYGVRVGLEDNLWWDDERTQLATNISLVQRVHRIASEHERTHIPADVFGEAGFYNRSKLAEALTTVNDEMLV